LAEPRDFLPHSAAPERLRTATAEASAGMSCAHSLSKKCTLTRLLAQQNLCLECCPCGDVPKSSGLSIGSPECHRQASNLNNLNTREAIAGSLRRGVNLRNAARKGGSMLPEHLGRIRSICDALAAAGFDTLDKQAHVLSLPRSTTWTIVHANHKKSGLSAGLLGRMLKSHRLPASVRAKIIEYIEAKVDGSFGHNKIQQRRFRNRLKMVHLTTPRISGERGQEPQAHARIRSRAGASKVRQSPFLAP